MNRRVEGTAGAFSENPPESDAALQPEWCVFYAYGGIDGYDFNMSIQRADTAEEAAAMAAGEYGDEADRWVVPREHVRKFAMERVWKPEEYAVKAEESVQ